MIGSLLTRSSQTIFLLFTAVKVFLELQFFQIDSCGRSTILLTFAVGLKMDSLKYFAKDANPVQVIKWHSFRKILQKAIVHNELSSRCSDTNCSKDSLES